MKTQYIKNLILVTTAIMSLYATGSGEYNAFTPRPDPTLEIRQELEQREQNLRESLRLAQERHAERDETRRKAREALYAARAAQTAEKMAKFKSNLEQEKKLQEEMNLRQQALKEQKASLRAEIDAQKARLRAEKQKKAKAEEAANAIPEGDPVAVLAEQNNQLDQLLEDLKAEALEADDAVAEETEEVVKKSPKEKFEQLDQEIKELCAKVDQLDATHTLRLERRKQERKADTTPTPAVTETAEDRTARQKESFRKRRDEIMAQYAAAKAERAQQEAARIAKEAEAKEAEAKEALERAQQNAKLEEEYKVVNRRMHDLIQRYNQLSDEQKDSLAEEYAKVVHSASKFLRITERLLKTNRPKPQPQ